MLKVVLKVLEGVVVVIEMRDREIMGIERERYIERE